MAPVGLKQEDQQRPTLPKQQADAEAIARQDEQDAELLPYLERYEAARTNNRYQPPQERLRRILEPIVDAQLKLRSAEALLAAELDWRLRDKGRAAPVQRREFSELLPEFSQAVEQVFPSRIGEYKIDAIVGHGNFGRVYRGSHQGSRELAAIKVLVEYSEEINLPRIRHRRVVPTLEVGKTGGKCFLVMPYIEGGSLAEYLKQNCKAGTSEYADLKEVTKIIRQIAEGLVAIHRRHSFHGGLIHRDLKPENILLNKEGNVHIADLGMALLQDQRHSKAARTKIAGTTPYMAPEMLAYGMPDAEPRSFPSLTAAADLWAVGVMMYQLLTNEYPFGDSPVDVESIHANVVQSPPQDPRFRRPELPEHISAICMNCLRIDRNERYSSASQLLRALGGGSRRWLFQGVAVLLAAALISSLSLAYRTRRKPFGTPNSVRTEKQIPITAEESPSCPKIEQTSSGAGSPNIACTGSVVLTIDQISGSKGQEESSGAETRRPADSQDKTNKKTKSRLDTQPAGFGEGEQGGGTRQSSSGTGSPNLYGVRGDVNVTIGQGSGKKELQKSKPDEKKQQ